MNRRLRPMAAVVLVSALAGCSRSSSAPEVAAVVEGRKIPAAQTEALLTTAGSGAPLDGDRKQSLTHFVLLYQIKHALLRHLAEGMNISVEARGLTPEAEAGRLSEAMARRLFPDVADEERQGRFMEWFDGRLRAAKVRVDGHFGRWDSGRGVVQ